ncbi:hypothetical protein LRHMDP3_1960 [Lacticaseibacillus rhamnosus LRHMDP3]|uniref:Uncharacterized protein n=1 Tax=Lacticaseibacillus rhamnosus LRHMDP3 TaxID=1203259 RepID=A0AB33XTK7_LACRH|nr:hypothetical protein LRHMDP3_1960 [Lacticaseibacillus rhamnosus LRHMDP3]
MKKCVIHLASSKRMKSKEKPVMTNNWSHRLFFWNQLFWMG